jgi:ribosomal protein S18 acetylase RimI-like enzyme
VTIRPATAADIPYVMNLERQCPTAAHWTQGQYEQLFYPGAAGGESLVVVAEAELPVPRPEPDAGFGLTGFLVARRLALEWELENIVVASTTRRMGLGKRLLDVLLIRARETNSDTVFLEVRESNIAARTLYEKAGFQWSGRRQFYYTNPVEDAVLYHWTLD